MSHTHTRLLYHIVFATKGRRGLITESIRECLHAYMGGVLRNLDAKPIAIGGTKDHVHLLAELPASASVADVMRVLKANSSKWVHETFPAHREFAWQAGYAAFSVSASISDQVIQYIRSQEAHHRTSTFEHEFVAFLRRHEIEYDERYVFG